MLRHVSPSIHLCIVYANTQALRGPSLRNSDHLWGRVRSYKAVHCSRAAIKFYARLTVALSNLVEMRTLATLYYR